MEYIDILIEQEMAEFNETKKQHNEYIRFLKKQKKCAHEWKYHKATSEDEWGFSLPERIICNKCKLEIWNRDLDIKTKSYFDKIKETFAS